jgi:predicted transcriptional regulator
MPNLIQLTAQIVSAHLSNQQMTSDEMLQELQKVHASLKALEAGSPIAIESSASTEAPKLTIKQAFKKDEVICMVCGKGGFKTIKRHLSMIHGLKPGQYRKQFNIPSTQSLAAKNYSESRRKAAIENNLGAGLEKARATRKANSAKKAAAVPMVKVKAPVPAVKLKATVPAKITKNK